MKAIKIVTIVGARPQIIKAAALSRAIRTHFSDLLNELIIHTGQHYDTQMSEVFFTELNLPQPHYNLHVGSAAHGEQTAHMLEGIERILQDEQPDYVIVYGDTNSTLAGALAASKMHIDIVHIEAGLRSFNKQMPEEINRILTDHCATLLFTPTQNGFDNLLREGFRPFKQAPCSADNPGVFLCGDIMLDNCMFYSNRDSNTQNYHTKNHILSENYILCTIHRDHNTDNPIRLTAIFKALIRLSSLTGQKIILPIHPRTLKMLSKNLDEKLHEIVLQGDMIQLIEPASYTEMIELEKNASLIITDSGGVQKEAFFLKKPCVILRSQTEWVEIIETGSAKVVDADEDKIVAGALEYLNQPPTNFPPLFGDGKAANFICEIILQNKQHQKF